ncbi:MAG: hypothetical protein J6S67_21595 [Methanobrevibacter sp.]|nr:hypothetical protein [Methanobrevibacter sp.]
MVGTKEGGEKTKNTIYEKYGKDHFKKIGAIGGRKCVPKGFAKNPTLAHLAGMKGGKISKRGKAKK